MAQPADLDSKLELTGETVTVSYLADPSVGHGQFRLSNRADSALTAHVAWAWLEQGEQRRPLTNVGVFELAGEHMLDPEGFRVEANSSTTFLLSFPKIRYEPPFGTQVAVGLRLEVNGVRLEARSPIELIRRIPRVPK